MRRTGVQEQRELGIHLTQVTPRCSILWLPARTARPPWRYDRVRRRLHEDGLPRTISVALAAGPTVFAVAGCVEMSPDAWLVRKVVCSKQPALAYVRSPVTRRQNCKTRAARGGAVMVPGDVVTSSSQIVTGPRLGSRALGLRCYRLDLDSSTKGIKLEAGDRWPRLRCAIRPNPTRAPGARGTAGRYALRSIAKR